MANELGDGPIEPKYKDLLNGLAAGIDKILNGPHPMPRETGFVLLVFPFDGHEGRCNYISNAKRDDIVVLLREQLRRFEGAPDVKGTA